MNTALHADTLVIGGGVVGLSVAYGLAKAGERVELLDGADDAFRAARGNFGLVWVQGKGHANADYARWTMAAAKEWPTLSAELLARTGIDVALRQVGGLNLCLDEAELKESADELKSIGQALQIDYPYEVLDQQQVRALMSQIGPDVVGATYCPMDGDVNPLRLLQALVSAFEAVDGIYLSGLTVQNIEKRAGKFEVKTANSTHTATKIVLAAGLGNRALAPMVGLRAPVTPNRGQIAVTERLQPFLTHPTLQLRQTDEGSMQIGYTNEDVGLNDETSLSQLSGITDRAMRYFPLLRDVNIVRTWGALRVMSPDGYPIYQESSACPGAFVLTCHSGITLASKHAGEIAHWVMGGTKPSAIAGFHAERFDV